MLKSLLIENIRNISCAEIEFCKGLNFFVGDNGAGKTSILEALHLLLVGRSFRAQGIKEVVSFDQQQLIVSGSFFPPISNDTLCAQRVENTDFYSDRMAILVSHGASNYIGLRKTLKGKTDLKLNGETQFSYAALAQQYPVQIIAPEVPHLIDGQPLYRRRFLDWGVFHVEHSYVIHWKRFNRLLKHRNILLKSTDVDSKTLRAIDNQFSEVSSQLYCMRERYWQQFRIFLNSMSCCLHDLGSFHFSLDQGWGVAVTDFEDEYTGSLMEEKVLSMIKEKLAKSLGGDIRYRSTQFGPHKANISIYIDGRDIRKVLSRGQKKVLYVWLKFMQVNFLKSTFKKSTLCLLDDISSELDEENKAWCFDLIVQLGLQVVCTSIESYPTDQREDYECRLFHVKQGEIISM